MQWTLSHRGTTLARLAAVGCLCCVALTVSAQSDKPFAAPTATVPSTPAGAAGLAQVTLSLLLVLAAVFAVAWLVRRARSLGKFGAPAITVIADVGLGPKERAVLVQVGSKQLLLGVAPGRVSTLHVLDEPINANDAAVAAALGTDPNAAPDFKSILKRSLGLK